MSEMVKGQSEAEQKKKEAGEMGEKLKLSLVGINERK